MLLKCCTQYVSICRKLGSGHRTVKGRFSFQSQRRAMPNNVQTTTQLCSFFMLVGYAQNPSSQASAVCEPRTSRYTNDLEKAEEPEIKLPTSARSQKKQGDSRKTICFYCIDYAKAFLDHNKLWNLPKEMRIPYHLTCLLRNLIAGKEATLRTVHGKID